ncbi:hypothetical protein DFQ27_002774 [Actinomortierella ambigua]|uniref:BZIP domain-containing protein n=1 Tax=Actinomortierella ambigua TaxID=1343610 RepID=A0A9P6Q8Q2_9FUNG|nr:hypothetical protein DFQ27_002774 [Actinomortierella ambigua]
MSPQPAVDMVALASAADAPFDSEAPFADLGNEAIVTIESASPRSNTGPLSPSTTTTSAAQASTPTPSAADLESFFALDANFLALATSSSSSSSSSSCAATTTSQTIVGTVSPMALKLESPLLTPLTAPVTRRRSSTLRGSATKTAAKRARTDTTTTSSSIPSTPSSTSTSTTSSTGPRKRSQDPADKEARARERVLRNRAAAQESRDKKRKYVAEIEESNAHLQQENSQLQKRLKTVEEDNQALSKRLEALTAQFEKMQQQLTMICSTGKGGRDASLDQLSAAEAGSTPQEEPSEDLDLSEHEQDTLDDGSIRSDDEETLIEDSSSPLSVAASEMSELQGDLQSVLSLQQRQDFDALLLYTSLFAAPVGGVAVGQAAIDPSVATATADADLFESFLDLGNDWSSLEQQQQQHHQQFLTQLSATPSVVEPTASLF